MSVEFDPKFFTDILRSAGVNKLCRDAAQKVLARAQATAPYDTGDYHDGLTMGKLVGRDRDSWIVHGDDWKTMLVESQTGNLVRAVKSVKP